MLEGSAGSTCSVESVFDGAESDSGREGSLPFANLVVDVKEIIDTGGGSQAEKQGDHQDRYEGYFYFHS